MNESIALQSTMSPKITSKLKPGQKQFRKVSGASILALKKSIRRSLILDQSFENRKHEKLITIIDSSSASSLETLPPLQIKGTQEETVVISATESVCSTESRKSEHSSDKRPETHELNLLLTKYKFDNISKWVREVNENNSNSSLYTEMSTIQGSDDGKDLRPKSTKPTCAINSTFEQGHDKKFDKMFSQKEDKVLANNTPTTEESCNSSKNLTIEDSFEILNESLTTRINNRKKKEVKKITPPSTPVNTSEKWSYIQFSEDSTNSNKENSGLENVSKTPMNEFLPKWREIEISGTDDSGEDNSYTNILDSLYGKSWRLQKELTASVKKIRSTPQINSDRKEQSSRPNGDDVKSPLREANRNEPRKNGRKLWFGDKDLSSADISTKQNRIKRLPKFNSKPTARNKNSRKKSEDSDNSSNLLIVEKNKTNRTSSNSSSDDIIATKITRGNRKAVFTSSDSSNSSDIDIRQDNKNSPAPLTDRISLKKNPIEKPHTIDAKPTHSRNSTKDSDDSDSFCNLPTVKKKNRSDTKDKNNYLNRNTRFDSSNSSDASLGSREGTKIKPVPSESKTTNDHKVFTKKTDFKLPTPTINISDESESSSDEEWNKTISKAKKDRRLTINNDGFYSFLSSLSAEVPISKCSFSARIYRTAFKHHKDELVKKLFKLFNETVFNKLLPENFEFEWKDKLRKTAGTCRSIKVTKRTGVVERKSIIHLSTKVLDRAERLRDTLIHELCHAATWVINGVVDGHGDMWKAWARKAMVTHPELPPINRCHNYIITTKYTYKCTQCGYSIGRHSKSLDTDTKRCGYCYGKFELLINKTNKKGETKAVAATPKKEATGFARFVKENYGAHKNPSRTHADVMKVLGQKFKELQIDKTSHT